jgi:asparagine synthase (glutamine-hydrolysing)
LGLHADHGRLTVRRNFLLLFWPPEAPDAEALAARLQAAAAEAPTWRLAIARPGLALWLAGPEDLPVRVLGPGGGVLIGEVFGRADGEPELEAVDPVCVARALAGRAWGQFIALLGRAPGERWIYRDPSGVVDALTWRLGDGVSVVASALTELPRGFSPRRMALHWDRIVEFLGVPTAATTPALLSDVTAVGPGELLPVGGGPAREIWSPVAFASPVDASADELAAEFVGRVDACTDALVGSHNRVLMELSGGLDSSTLAASVAATGNLLRVVEWLNVADERPEADEQRYAEAVAQALGVPLTVDRRRPQALGDADVADLGGQTWPMIAGVDATRDRDEFERAMRHGATAILSGQGGDAVFFQMASALVAADALEDRGAALLWDPLLAQVARRVRASVWSVYTEARRALRTGASGPKHVNALLTREAHDAVAGLEHAWVRAAQRSDLPPGKRFHIRALATNHFNHACSRRRQVADLLFPLLAQPVLELALSVPTPVLAGGNHARPFQRTAFAHRLPPLVRERRAKGNVSVYLAQMMARSIPFLREYLLGGCLTDAAVLDRSKLGQVLDRDFMIGAAVGNDLVGAIAVEAWVRHWQRFAPDAPASRPWR